MDVIRQYAARKGLEIIQTYSDEGKSGLNIQGRDSLAQMIRDVQSGQVKFSCILVYDVSRWGRFQDADESAYYEYTCRQAGVAVHYCAEQFENDGSPVSTIVKGVKRAMAGEYSRELSTKVFLGACRLIQLGYKQGGTAGYGLRRMLIDQSGEKKALLKMGEQKSLQTDRVILVPGPDDEVKVVKWIYIAFVEEGKTESEIATLLNERGAVTDFGRAWTRGTVHQVLTNEKYIGNNVYHRTSFKLKRTHVVNPPEKWIRADGAFKGIIEPELFFKAREIILARAQRFTDEEMLLQLRGVLQQFGRISGIIIDEVDGLPSSSSFRHRFGSLVRAYRLIGYRRGFTEESDPYVRRTRSTTRRDIGGAGRGKNFEKTTTNRDKTYDIFMTVLCKSLIINGAGEGNRIYHVFSLPCISVQCCAAYESVVFRQTARNCTQLQKFWHHLAPNPDAQIIGGALISPVACAIKCPWKLASCGSG